MKVIKSVFLLILLMGAWVARSADGYLNENLVWTYGYLNTYSGFPSISGKTLYYLKGDTVIAGLTYHKVLSDYGSVEPIRESGKKWYIRSRYNANEEIVLYDFSAGLGDTIKAPGSVGYTAYYNVVTHVDTVILENGERRKRMEIGHSYVWIEGIGDLRSFTGPVDPIPTCGIGCIGLQTMLLCYKQKGIVLYSDLTYCTDCCSYGASQGLESTTFPSGLRWLLSTDGLLEYLLPDRTQVICNAKLINLSGSTVWEARAGFDNGGGRIPVSHLPHGIYMLRVQSSLGVVVQKVSI